MFFLFLFHRIFSLEFSLTDSNAEELANISMTKPVFIIFRSPYCPHCQKVGPFWLMLTSQYRDNENIVIANSDCVAYKKSCQYFMDVHSYPTFAVIDKNITTKTYVERKVEEWAKLVDRLIYFGQNYKCNKWFDQMGDFPMFIITTTKNAEDTCSEILKIQREVPQSEGHLYANPNGTEYSCQINLNEEYSFTYGNQTNSSIFVPLVREFIFNPLGNWSISEAAQIERRIGFFVYSNEYMLSKFKDLVINQSMNFAIGKIEYEKFNLLYPQIELEKSELPALGLSDDSHKKFLLLTSVKLNDDLYTRLANISNGDEDADMAFSMAKLLGIEESSHKWIAISAFVVAILAIAFVAVRWLLLSSDNSYKDRFDKKHRNTLLNDIKVLFNENCKRFKVPDSLL